MHLKHKDVRLGSFKSDKKKKHILNHFAGEKLFKNDSSWSIYGTDLKIFYLSNEFMGKLLELENKGYTIIDSSIRNIVYWRDKEDLDTEWAIILPEFKLSKNATPPKLPEIEKVKEDLFEALRTLRWKISKEEGVRPFMVLHDSCLRKIANSMPSSLSELSRIEGIGPAKLEKYGLRIINEIHNFLDKQG